MVEIVKVAKKAIIDGWELYKKIWKPLIPFMMLIAFLTVIIEFSEFSSIGMVATRFIGAYVMLTLTFTLIDYINQQYEGAKEQNLMNYLTRNLVSSFVFGLFHLLVLGIFGVIAIIAGVAIVGSGALGKDISALSAIIGTLLIALLIMILLLIIYLIILFFIQFTPYEMAGGRVGLIRALGNSIAIVKPQIIEVFVLGIIFIIVSIVIGIPALILSLLGGIFGAAAMLIINNPVLHIIFQLPASAYLFLLMLPLEHAIMVRYWRLMKGIEKV